MLFNPSQRVLSRTEFIALIAGFMALNAIAIDVMLPALPYMGAALDVPGENERQLVITAYMLGFGVAQLAYGPLTDTFGRRTPLLIGIVIYVVAAFAAAFTPEFGILLALRAVQGVGAAGTRVIATSLVRDRYSGRLMAEVMSLVFMTFMVVPIFAPGVGQVLLLTGPWQHIFYFMTGLATLIGVWGYIRLPETLPEAHRRALKFSTVVEGFRLVFTNRVALSYGLAGMFMFGGLFGFISSAQQIYVDIYGLGPYFPVAFAAVAALMSLANFLNSRIVARYGMRRMSHFALLIYIAGAALMLVLAALNLLPLWAFMFLLATIMWMFGWCGPNMNSLSMEPLGAVAGTASAVFGSVQTVGGALLGSVAGLTFDGTVRPVAAGYLAMGVAALVCCLVAERGRLFGVGARYAEAEVTGAE